MISRSNAENAKRVASAEARSHEVSKAKAEESRMAAALSAPSNPSSASRPPFSKAPSASMPPPRVTPAKRKPDAAAEPVDPVDVPIPDTQDDDWELPPPADAASEAPPPSTDDEEVIAPRPAAGGRARAFFNPNVLAQSSAPSESNASGANRWSRPAGDSRPIFGGATGPRKC